MVNSTSVAINRVVFSELLEELVTLLELTSATELELTITGSIFVPFSYSLISILPMPE